MKAELENLKHMDILDDEVSVTSSYRENNESDMDALVDALVASINKNNIVLKTGRRVNLRPVIMSYFL